MAKILFVSYVPPHPRDYGHRNRVFTLLTALNQLGHDTHFLYCFLPQFSGDAATLGESVAAMRQKWGDKFHLFEFTSNVSNNVSKVAKRLSALPEWVKIPLRAGVGCMAATSRLVRRILGSDVLVDRWYFPQLDEELRKLQATHRFDTVMVTYIFTSRALEVFDPGVVRLLDTIDYFSLRTKTFTRLGLAEHTMFPVSEEEEIKALRRADIVVAIQEGENESFRKLGLSKVVTVGHFCDVHPVAPPPPSPVVLFVGGLYQINADGMNWFFDNVLPHVLAKVPHLEVRIVGRVCEQLPTVPACVRKLGFVPSLTDMYREASVVINPVPVGSGVSIKSVEALAAGCPLVATRCGARGLEETVGRGVVMTDDPTEFAEALVELLTDPVRRDTFARQGNDFVAEQNEIYLSRLQSIVTGQMPHGPATAPLRTEVSRPAG